MVLRDRETKTIMNATLPSPLLHTLSLDPVRAEVAAEFPWSLEPGDEIRGKLEGPQCRYAGTIEIAYPLRKVGEAYQFTLPEPSAWSPITPFVYAGKFEWLRNGVKLGAARALHGLLRLTLGPTGWLLNGKPFEERATELNSPTEEELLQHRNAGFNTLITPTIDLTSWDQAARIGFFIRPMGSQTLPHQLQSHFLFRPTPGGGQG